MKVNSPFKNHTSKFFPEKFLFRFLFFTLFIIIVVSTVLLLSKINTTFSKQIEQKPDPGSYHKVQLEVLNGCGVSGLAEKFTDFLRKNNFDVVNTGNYKSFDIDYSLVIDRTGNIEKALLLAEKLGIDEKNVFSQINKSYFLDVTLIVGRDFQQLKPYQQ